MIRRLAFENRIKAAEEAKQGGGKNGALAGAAIGGLISAGGGPGAAIAGAGGGASLGSMIGEAINPSQAQSAMSRRVEAMQPVAPAPSESSEKLKQSIMALHSAPQPVRDEYGPQLIQAYLTSLANDRRA